MSIFKRTQETDVIVFIHWRNEQWRHSLVFPGDLDERWPSASVDPCRCVPTKIQACPESDPVYNNTHCVNSSVTNVMTSQCFVRSSSHLRCSSLMRTIMLRWPCEYCSMTSRTSYGLRACYNSHEMSQHEGWAKWFVEIRDLIPMMTSRTQSHVAKNIPETFAEQQNIEFAESLGWPFDALPLVCNYLKT